MQFCLSFAGYPKVLTWLQRRGHGKAHFQNLRENLLRLQKRQCCPSSCLTQALVLFWCCHSNEKLTLKIGVSAQLPESPVAFNSHQNTTAILAHAWIEYNTRIVWGKVEQDFQVIYTEHSNKNYN